MYKVVVRLSDIYVNLNEKKVFCQLLCQIYENCGLRVRSTCVQIGGRTEGEFLTGLAYRCERLKKEVTCAVKTIAVY